MKFLAAGHLSDQIQGAGNVHAALPSNAELKDLSTIGICSALRTPTLHLAVQRLSLAAHRDPLETGPRLDDMKGDTPALVAARQLVSDLHDWKNGKAAWNELSRSILL